MIRVSPVHLKELWGSLVIQGLGGLPRGSSRLGIAFVAAPQRDYCLLLVPKITLALPDSFLRLVNSNTLSDFKHYL